jgi:hypothetical protein
MNSTPMRHPESAASAIAVRDFRIQLLEMRCDVLNATFNSAVCMAVLMTANIVLVLGMSVIVALKV